MGSRHPAQWSLTLVPGSWRARKPCQWTKTGIVGHSTPSQHTAQDRIGEDSQRTRETGNGGNWFSHNPLQTTKKRKRDSAKAHCRLCPAASALRVVPRHGAGIVGHARTLPDIFGHHLGAATAVMPRTSGITQCVGAGLFGRLDESWFAVMLGSHSIFVLTQKPSFC